jgi:hypothetical protein
MFFKYKIEKHMRVNENTKQQAIIEVEIASPIRLHYVLRSKVTQHV